MSLFVIAFIVQWWSLAFYGLWHLINKNIPQSVFQLLTTFANTGGFLNLIVYIIIRRRKSSHAAEVSSSSTSDRNTGMTSTHV